jgi:NADH:ubiquinone oxidoreductase subunit B-like Fe-S oxidoreductase
LYMYNYVCVCAHIEFIYIHINSRLDYLRFKLICLINSNDKILKIISVNLREKNNNHDIYFI